MYHTADSLGDALIYHVDTVHQKAKAREKQYLKHPSFLRTIGHPKGVERLVLTMSSVGLWMKVEEETQEY